MKKDDSTHLINQPGKSSNKIIIVGASVLGLAAIGVLVYLGFFGSNPWFGTKNKPESKAEIVQDPHSIKNQDVENVEDELEIVDEDSLYNEWDDIDPIKETEPQVTELAIIEAPSVSQKEVAAQNTNGSSQNVPDNEPFSVATIDVAPQFPGGLQAMYTWLGQNISYPASAAESGLAGKVIVSFVVEKDGSLSTFKVQKSVDPLLDQEALRVIKAMPKWTPGRCDGQPVRVTYTLPIKFSLN